MQQKIDNINWQEVTASLNEKGFALIEQFLNESQCTMLINLYDQTTGFRKIVNMERHRFGAGQYKYFSYPLPTLIQTIREGIYPHIAPTANSWMKVLNMDRLFPSSFAALQAQCHSAGQLHPTPLILRYKRGGHNTFHQDLYGEIYFPIQLAIFLNEPEKDYSGGEFVMTEQTPRSQSKAMVMRPKKGDMLLFTTNFRPIKGSRGYYRATMKHGVSEITKGERHTLGIIFHDALS